MLQVVYTHNCKHLDHKNYDCGTLGPNCFTGNASATM